MPKIDMDYVREATRETRYVFKAEVKDAPGTMNCLTFMSWIFLPTGHIIEPMMEISNTGMKIDMQNLAAWDIVVSQGRGYYIHPELGPIGHVGIVTETGTIIHATRRKNVNGVIEESLEEFLIHHGPFRTARRLL